jgi:hypothetical protein
MVAWHRLCRPGRRHAYCAVGDDRQRHSAQSTGLVVRLRRGLVFGPGHLAICRLATVAVPVDRAVPAPADFHRQTVAGLPAGACPAVLAYVVRLASGHPCRGQRRMAGGVGVPVLPAVASTVLRRTQRPTRTLRPVPAIAIWPAVCRGFRTGVLGRVRRALQLHRGGLPGLYHRSGGQHPRSSL